MKGPLLDLMAKEDRGRRISIYDTDSGVYLGDKTTEEFEPGLEYIFTDDTLEKMNKEEESHPPVDNQQPPYFGARCSRLSIDSLSGIYVGQTPRRESIDSHSGVYIGPRKSSNCLLYTSPSPRDS